jgi:hypothetical protein
VNLVLSLDNLPALEHFALVDQEQSEYSKLDYVSLPQQLKRLKIVSFLEHPEV